MHRETDLVHPSALSTVDQASTPSGICRNLVRGARLKLASDRGSRLP